MLRRTQFEQHLQLALLDESVSVLDELRKLLGRGPLRRNKMKPVRPVLLLGLSATLAGCASPPSLLSDPRSLLEARFETQARQDAQSGSRASSTSSSGSFEANPP